eukprot:scaffold95383_cov63-Phaeocystis_antarctica.AAC.1
MSKKIPPYLYVTQRLTQIDRMHHVQPRRTAPDSRGGLCVPRSQQIPLRDGEVLHLECVRAVRPHPHLAGSAGIGATARDFASNAGNRGPIDLPAHELAVPKVASPVNEPELRRASTRLARAVQVANLDAAVWADVVILDWGPPIFEHLDRERVRGVTERRVVDDGGRVAGVAKEARRVVAGGLVSLRGVELAVAARHWVAGRGGVGREQRQPTGVGGGATDEDAKTATANPVCRCTIGRRC